MFLALDSSTSTLSLALVQRAATGQWSSVEEREFAPPLKHSELLPGVIQELLTQRVPLAGLEGIAVGLGPGSFTGLRVGLATAKALAYAARLKLAGASSLKALALEGPEGSVLLTTAVARKNELYVGRYFRRGPAVELLAAEEAMTPAELAGLLVSDRKAIALGPAIEEYRVKLEEEGAEARQLWNKPAFPKAAAVAKLACWPEQFELESLFSLEPHYVRASEAERNPKFPAGAGPAPMARIKEK